MAAEEVTVADIGMVAENQLHMLIEYIAVTRTELPKSDPTELAKSEPVELAKSDPVEPAELAKSEPVELAKSDPAVTTTGDERSP